MAINNKRRVDTLPEAPWTQKDMRDAVLSLLNGWSEHWYNETEFRMLPSSSREAITKALLVEAKNHAEYEREIRGIERERR